MIVAEHKNFNMSIIQEKKHVHIQVIGFLKGPAVEAYVAALQETISKVDRPSFKLIVDASQQSPLPASVANKTYGDTLNFYLTFGFKEVCIVMPKSKIGYVQLRNTAEEIQYKGTLVDHITDIK